MSRVVGTPPTDRGVPPLPPVDLPGFATGEGPMRRELRRQIAVLERRHAEIRAMTGGWDSRQVNTQRGPSIQAGASLEKIRDELLRSVDELAAQIERGDLAPGVRR